MTLKLLASSLIPLLRSATVTDTILHVNSYYYKSVWCKRKWLLLRYEWSSSGLEWSLSPCTSSLATESAQVVFPCFIFSFWKWTKCGFPYTPPLRYIHTWIFFFFFKDCFGFDLWLSNHHIPSHSFHFVIWGRTRLFPFHTPHLLFCFRLAAKIDAVAPFSSLLRSSCEIIPETFATR